MEELTGRAYDVAQLELGPVQLNFPRDYLYAEADYVIPGPTQISRPAGNSNDIATMAKAIS